MTHLDPHDFEGCDELHPLPVQTPSCPLRQKSPGVVASGGDGGPASGEKEGNAMMSWFPISTDQTVSRISKLFLNLMTSSFISSSYKGRPTRISAISALFRAVPSIRGLSVFSLTHREDEGRIGRFKVHSNFRKVATGSFSFKLFFFVVFEPLVRRIRHRKNIASTPFQKKSRQEKVIFKSAHKT